MYIITEVQLNTLEYIINHLTVTGPIQGGLLNNAAGIIGVVRQQKNESKKEESNNDNK